jgi:hypothetical protein
MDQRPPPVSKETSVSPSRALVPVTISAAPLFIGRPASDFVMQLIACERRAPDFRMARRAEPASVALAYALPGAPSRPSLDRAV